MAAAVGVALDGARAAALLALRDLILHERRTAGLTAVADPSEFLEKHLVDSLSCIPVAAPQAGEALVDVGSGAGLPGLAVGVACPGVAVTCVEAVQRKAAFATRAAAALGVPARVVHARAEDLGQDPEYRERFDVAVARAVAPMPVLLELTLPLCRPGGRFVALKGPRADAEVEAARRALEVLGGEVEEVRRLRLPRSGAERRLVLVRKVRPGPEGFPRRAGVPERRPLS
jgi:16S rRNA (guanine527-N7)-methyltransferase